MNTNDQHIEHLELAHAIMTRVQDLTQQCNACVGPAQADDLATVERTARAAWRECADLQKQAETLPLEEAFQQTRTQLEAVADLALDWIDFARKWQGRRETSGVLSGATPDTLRNLF